MSYVEVYDKIKTYPETPNVYYYYNQLTNERYKIRKGEKLFIREYDPATKKYSKKPASHVYGHMVNAIAKYHSCLDAMHKDTNWHIKESD